MKNENKTKHPMDGKNDVHTTSKKRNENPIDILESKTKIELLAEAKNAGIKGRHQLNKNNLIHAIRNNLK